jgi:FAD/FMN-containing dehydrogenase
MTTSAAATGLPIAELIDRIRADLGEEIISTDPARLARASVDWAHMSPILRAKLPAGRADVLAIPARAEDIPVLLRHAHDLGVPVTPRGTGLGNYGQAIPLRGGMVLDTSRCRRVVEVRAGSVTAEAGVRLRDLDSAVAGTGQELPIFPSTKGSTLGGFLAGGSGGTGSLIHGTNADGFVLALDIAACDGSGELRHVAGPEHTLPYVHAYGTTGIIARATVRLVPAGEWVGVFTAWHDYPAATGFLRALRAVTPSPRLVSLDEAPIVAALPEDPALDPNRLSVRAIVPAAAVAEVRDLVARHGGEVLAERTGALGAERISALSFNHSTFHLQKRDPGYFHLEVAGDPLWTEPDAVRAVFPDTVLHLELMRHTVAGMLMARFVSAEQVYAGMRRLTELGVSIHSPHTWTLERRIETVRSVLADNDPRGLLNPGKLAQQEETDAVVH